MARMSMEEAEKLSSGTISYFSIKENGGTALIRILYDSNSDVSVIGTHRVEYKGRDRNIECIKEHPEDPDETCPLCAAGAKSYNKVFVPVWDMEEGCVKLWEKGITFTKKLTALFASFPHLWEEIIEVKRVDVKDRPDYKLMVITEDYDQSDSVFDFNIEDVEIPNVADGISLMLVQKTKEEMEYFIANGRFEDDLPGKYERRDSGNQSSGGGEQGYRRRGSSDGENKGSGGYSTRVGQQTDRPNRRREF